MARIVNALRDFFTSTQPIAPGMYHYQAPADDPRDYRLHLRINPDGQGVLIVNAATILHLNETATEYAYYFVQNLPADDVARKMAARYRVSAAQAAEDYRNLASRVLALIETPDLDPVTFLDFERSTPFSGEISAPYRLDCALTYRLPDGANPEFAPQKRVTRELSTGEWQQVIQKAWDAGIPHIVFTGGEPTLRQDLPDLIAAAESNGQVSGLLSDGLRLADKAYLDELLQTGLDHLLILQPSDARAWQGLQNALDGDIFTAVHLTLTTANLDQVMQTIRDLAARGVHGISLSASQDDLAEPLQSARELVASLDINLIWDLPVPYSAHNPIAFEVAPEMTTEGQGRAWLYVEPDGDVLPAQGINRILGNLVSDSWESIWQQAAGEAQ